jgi:multiple antibiotic resistance protein
VSHLLEVIGLGLLAVLPLANPLTTVALFIGLSGDMTRSQREQQSRRTALYVFVILMVAYYGGQAVMNAFGISIPGLRIGGGVIVSSIGFSMLFPKTTLDDTVEVGAKSAELERRAAKDIALFRSRCRRRRAPGQLPWWSRSPRPWARATASNPGC